jgi:hypothetical protein
MKRLVSTIFSSILISTSSHFVATLVCYFWLVYDTNDYSIDRTILFWVLYHLIALYISFTGLRAMGYFRDRSSFRITIYAIIFIVTHFVSFFIWLFYKQEIITALKQFALSLAGGF